VLYRHLPSAGIHRYAKSAAIASECAAAAGRFKEFHDVLYATPDSIGRASWGSLAHQAGIADTVNFARCLADSSYSDRVQRDVAAAMTLKAQGTPTVLVNGRRVTAAPTLALLDSLVELGLRATR
jgi:protein-disulfide isomerase